MMLKPIKLLVFIVCFSSLLSTELFAIVSREPNFSYKTIQIDSLILEKSINSDMTQLELLILYEDAWVQKHPDSINILKKLALLNAELEQSEDALFYTEKYIKNTFDFSILANGAYDELAGTPEYDLLNKKYMPQISILAFVYFCAALIGFYFMVVINFVKNSNKKTKLFIGGFIGCHALFIFEFVLFMTNLQYRFPHSYRVSSIVALLFGPLLFLYFKSIIEKEKLNRIDALHFLPGLLFLIMSLPLYFSNSHEKLELILGVNPLKKTYDGIVFVAKVVSLCVYAFFISSLLFGEKGLFKQEGEIGKWKRNIFILYIAYTVLYIIYGLSVFNVLGIWSSVIYNIQIGLMSITVVYIAHMAYVQPAILRKYNENYLIEKYQKSGLTNALSEELKESLVKLFIEDKVYKESNISLEILSNKLNTTRHNTSQIINEHFNMNFFELINKFRIKEAVNMFDDDVKGNLNIIDVAYEVGYNNKVTFNKAFKKEMSVTPSEYIQSQNLNR